MRGLAFLAVLCLWATPASSFQGLNVIIRTIGGAAAEKLRLALDTSSTRLNPNFAALSMSLRPDSDQSRRSFLAGAAVAASSLVLPPVSPAWAATGLQQSLDVLGYGPVPPADPVAGLLSFLGGKGGTPDRRPKPLKLPRGYVYRPFAVLMMRSCYNSADELDFVPMDQFQKDFFLLRQDEWEKYLAENDAQQGDLSDPKYFDFISAAQFATITRDMRDGKLIFEELTGAEGTKNVVSRGASIPQNNELLPPALYRQAGSAIYEGMITNYTGPQFLVKPPSVISGGGDLEVKAGMKQLYDFLVENGYCLTSESIDGGALPPQEYQNEVLRLKSWQNLVGDASPPATRGGGFKFSVTMRAPCILWGRQWLMLQGYIPNDHDVMIGMEFLRRCGRAVTVRTTSVTENSITREYNIL